MPARGSVEEILDGLIADPFDKVRVVENKR